MAFKEYADYDGLGLAPNWSRRRSTGSSGTTAC